MINEDYKKEDIESFKKWFNETYNIEPDITDAPDIFMLELWSVKQSELKEQQKVIEMMGDVMLCVCDELNDFNCQKCQCLNQELVKKYFKGE